MEQLIEDIVLTEEDEKILDEVWKRMRLRLIQKRKQEEAQKRRKAAQEVRKLAREDAAFRAVLVRELKRG